MIYFFSFQFKKNSAPTVIAKQWPNAHCVDERHIVQRFANERTGMHIRLNVQHVIQMKPHNKLCYWSMNRHKQQQLFFCRITHILHLYFNINIVFTCSEQTKKMRKRRENERKREREREGEKKINNDND